ncbi:MAG: GTPase ObgE, partial [Actinomycetota bacterium]|nr:GTPase ObgE [Actinomycetota bacterium]
SDEVLLVPPGTVVRDDAGRVVADLVSEDDEAVLVPGGRGGRGNAAFKTRARRAPRFHERGEPGHEAELVLELRLAADAALVGFPNAGKSSLVARLSAARPKVADYPFTTLAPTLGVVRAGDVDFVVADVPGLVEGASRGRGLGYRFLRHVERARVLVHVLDCASYEQRDPREDLRVVLAELEAYQPELVARPALVWLNKVDAGRDTAAAVRPDLEAAGWEVLEGSAVTGAGLEVLRRRLSELVARARLAAPARRAPDRPVLRPVAAEADDFDVARVDGGFRVTGARVERWVHMTDLDNEEAVGYLQDRLRRAGVERALQRAGARHGDAVEIAGRVFDFSPEEAPDGGRTAAW